MAKKTKTPSPEPDSPDQELPNTLSPEERQRAHEEQFSSPKEGIDGAPEPPIDGPYADNPENPRGIPSNMTSGAPDSQATDSQKIQNPTPQRPPLSASMDPPVTVFERVSAAQNRKPPQEQVP